MLAGSKKSYSLLKKKSPKRDVKNKQNYLISSVLYSIFLSPIYALYFYIDYAANL